MLRRVFRNRDGATIVEFALVAPVLLLMLFGVFDLSYNMYSTAILRGAMQDAARDSTIEYAPTDVIDAAVREQVMRVAPGATLTFERKAYAAFGEISQPEDFEDENGDGSCNMGEAFEDANGNGLYDTDRGIVGQGGSRDAVVYSATMSYRRMFPIAGFAGVPEDFTTTAQAVLRNQPYDNTGGAPLVGNCP